MSELREHEADQPANEPVETRGLDVDRIRDLTAQGDTNAIDPRVRVYNPLEHEPSSDRREEPDAGGAGLESPRLLGLRDKVRLESQDRFEPSDAEQLAEKTEPKVGGIPEDAGEGNRPTSARRDNPATVVDASEPAEDDFGPIDVERWRDVPCADKRPQRVYELDASDLPIEEAEAEAITAARERVAEVLEDAGEELTADDVQEALQYVNPTGGTLNCVECAMAVDDILRGRAAVAGPTEDQAPYQLGSALSVRAIDYVEDIDAAGVERMLLEAGDGARGIVIGWKDERPVHAYNVANLEGELHWLDGQRDRMTEHDPYRISTFDLYRTG